MRIFGIDIAAEVNNAVSAAGGVLDATLVKVAPGTRTAGDLAGGTNPTQTNYACKGFVEPTSKTSGGTFLEISPGDLTVEETTKVTLLGASIASGAVPVGGDIVTIEGSSYAIVQVDRDPAGATYTLTCRGA